MKRYILFVFCTLILCIPHLVFAADGCFKHNKQEIPLEDYSYFFARVLGKDNQDYKIEIESVVKQGRFDSGLKDKASSTSWIIGTNTVRIDSGEVYLMEVHKSSLVKAWKKDRFNIDQQGNLKLKYINNAEDALVQNYFDTGKSGSLIPRVFYYGGILNKIKFYAFGNQSVDSFGNQIYPKYSWSYLSGKIVWSTTAFLIVIMLSLMLLNLGYKTKMFIFLFLLNLLMIGTHYVVYVMSLVFHITDVVPIFTILLMSLLSSLFLDVKYLPKKKVALRCLFVSMCNALMVFLYLVTVDFMEHRGVSIDSSALLEAFKNVTFLSSYMNHIYVITSILIYSVLMYVLVMMNQRSGK